ncbi:DUF3108 domain-containing protein [Candidatus Proelusimicrobium volucris]|uniref:DUF3108 domain-containing protein n=1 Tax=Candidatus Proelusimicrobium volucris TaxID=3416225 RepID=UPI003D135EFA
MRFFTVLILSSVLLLPACATKNNKVVLQEQGTPVQTPAIEQVEEEKQKPTQEPPAVKETEEEPQTFTQSLIKFFSPSPSPSQKEKLNEEQTKAEQKAKQKQTNKTAAEQQSKDGKAQTKAENTDKNAGTPAEEEQKQFPEMNAYDDPEAVILKTEEGRLTSPFYFAQDATIEQTKSLKKPVWFGETLKYNIGWSFIVAGVAQLQTTRIVDSNGTLAYELRADANSHSIIDALFKVRDINISWLDITAKKSLGYWQSVREGKYARDEWLAFNYANNTYNNHRQDRDGNIKTQKMTFEGEEVLDMLSALYYVRLQPLPEKGEIYFDIVNRQKQYPLKVTVLGKKKVKVKAGEFNCIVVEPQFSGEGIFTAKGKSLKVWLTDDERRLPVKMSVEVFIGSVTAELTEYSLSEQTPNTSETK